MRQAEPPDHTGTRGRAASRRGRGASADIELHALVLAAGAASRFGGLKQLVTLEGRPLLCGITERATEVADRTWVVLGARAAEIAPVLAEYPVSVLVNPLWSEGLASSIRTGIAHLPPSCGAVLLLLADQARVCGEDLRRLASTWRRRSQGIAAAQHGTVVGVPAIFPRVLFAELSQLTGDVGARGLIARHASQVTTVPMPNAAFDLDTPADLASLRDGTGPEGHSR